MSFLRFLDMSPAEAHHLHWTSVFQRRLLALESEREMMESDPYVMFVVSSHCRPYP